MGAAGNIREWLTGLGLERYADAFEANDVDLTLARDLTEADLAELGVRSVGHRRKLATAIAALRSPEAPEAPPPATPAAAARPEAERRQITVMFCDLVGFTALSETLDPEDLHAVVGRYHVLVRDGVQGAGGFVAKYLGDGVLAYFGYPQAHEDDAERSVRAALTILAAIGEAELPGGGPMQARIGLATGRVVVGDLIGEGAAREQAVVGDTPNLASRLQALAAPQQIVIPASTRRLLGRLFRLRDLGEHALKGIRQPVHAWAVEGALEPRSRFAALRRRVPADMTGRVAERRLIAGLRERAWAGDGQVAVLSGEPGIGKSRLAAWLASDSAPRRPLRVSYQCAPSYGDSPLFPFIRQIRDAAGLRRSAEPVEQRRKLAALLGSVMTDPGRALPLLAALLEIPGESLGLTPAQQRADTFAACLAVLEGMAQRRPLLLLFEDLHWADPTSLELLDLMAERIRTLPAMLVVTTRRELAPGAAPRWHGWPGVTSLQLDRMDTDDILAIAASAARRLPPDALRQIAARADGNPLFAEEIARTVVDMGLLALSQTRDLAVPDTLHDLLMARLDSIGPAKEVAQIGAAIGREFTPSLLAEVHDGDDASLAAALARLLAAELVYRGSLGATSGGDGGGGDGADPVYTFKHALLQDAAYDSMLRARRTVLHRRIAEALAAKGPDQPGAEPEVVAQHYSRAGLLQEAMRWWGQGIERALRRSAYAEAVGHCRNVLALIEALGENNIDPAMLLKFYVDYGQALISNRGFDAPETYAAFQRANQLAARSADPQQRFAILYGLWSRQYVRGDLQACAELARPFHQDLLERPGSAEACVAFRVCGMTRWFHGDYRTACTFMEKAVQSYDPVRDRALKFRFSHDPGVAAAIHHGLLLWSIGEVEPGCASVARGNELGLSIDHDASAAYTHFYTALFECVRLRPDRAAVSLDAMLAMAETQGLPFWTRTALTMTGWIRCHEGFHEEGLAMIREGLDTFRVTDFGSSIPYSHYLFADVASSPAEIAEALAGLDAMLRDIGPSHGYWLTAELLRMRGEVLLRRDPSARDAADAAFRAALDVSRRQETRSFTLRAAISLARLHGPAEAETLRRALANFAEGPAMVEVAAGRALLRTLA